MAIVSLLSARGQRTSNVRHEAAFTFDDTVALFNADLVSYWKFQNTGTDQQGVSNATITGSPETNVPTIVKKDTINTGAPVDGVCIAWSGTVGDYAQAAHNAAHKTTVGTIVVYFQRDRDVEKSQLIMADPTPVAGGMAIGVNTSGAPDAHIRGAGGTPVTLIGGVGDVQIEQAYTLIFKWGTGGGMSLALWNSSGVLVRPRITNVSTIGLAGTSPIRFGATHNDTNHHDGPYGRVLWLDRRISDAEELTLAQALTVAREAGAYRELELSLNPLALWGLGELSGATILDTIAARNGTYAGAVGYNTIDLPENNAGGAVDFLGTGSGSIPHVSAFTLATFSLSFWFKSNHVPSEGEPGQPLFTKTVAAFTHGNFVVYLTDGVGLRVRFRDAALVAHEINTPEESIVQGATHHVCIRADNTGFDLHIDGKFYGKNTGYTNAWTPNTSAIGLASGSGFAITANCVLDEIALYPRYITELEVVQLAQRSGILPVAVEDPAEVPENATTAIQILANDEYVGAPTINLLSQPTPDTATIVAGVPPFINYAAGDVAVDTERTFNYRITDPNGQSNTTAVSVRVIADDTVAVTNANCYLASGLTNTPISPATMAELESRVNAASPGDHITIPSGTYAGGTLTFNPQGTAANPIVIRPVGARGSVTINDAVWNLQNTSVRLVIANIFFNNPLITIRGAHHRITRCQFRQINMACDVFAATDLRVDHCDASGFTAGLDRRFVHTRPTSIGTGALKRFLFDYNYCHDINNPDASEIVGVPSGGGGADFTFPGYVVDHNLFLNLSVSRIIGTKGSGWIISYNTFQNTPFQYCPRNGEGFEVRSNWFENNVNVLFVRALSDGLLVIGNRFVGGESMTVGPGHYYWVTGQSGVGAGSPAARDARIIGNLVETGFIHVGRAYNSPDPYTQPALRTNVVLTGPRANLKVNAAGVPIGGNPYTLDTTAIGGAPGQTGTTFADDTGPGSAFVPAEKLFPADVGMAAPDPLCPSGPQN